MFVHTHVHTDGSLQDGLSTVEEIIKRQRKTSNQLWLSQITETCSAKPKPTSWAKSME